jgi:hypothetical protein
MASSTPECYSRPSRLAETLSKKKPRRRSEQLGMQEGEMLAKSYVWLQSKRFGKFLADCVFCYCLCVKCIVCGGAYHGVLSFGCHIAFVGVTQCIGILVHIFVSRIVDTVKLFRALISYCTLLFDQI